MSIYKTGKIRKWLEKWGLAAFMLLVLSSFTLSSQEDRRLRQLPHPAKAARTLDVSAVPLRLLFFFKSRKPETPEQGGQIPSENLLFLGLFKLVQLFAEPSRLEALAVCCWRPNGDDVIVLI